MEEVVKKNWRHLTKWILKTVELREYLTQATIVKKFVPLILTQMKKGGKETRKE